MKTAAAKKKQLRLEGRCPDCGVFCFPYYQCDDHRMLQNIRRVARNLAKAGLVEVTIDPKDKRQKMYKWIKGAIDSKISRKYSVETMAKMMLPRMKGKPMTDELIKSCIMEVLDKNQVPLTEKEITRGIRSMKTIGHVVPEKENLVHEFKLIQEKKSTLSRSERQAVESRIKFLIERGALKQTEI